MLRQRIEPPDAERELWNFAGRGFHGEIECYRWIRYLSAPDARGHTKYGYVYPVEEFWPTTALS